MKERVVHIIHVVVMVTSTVLNLYDGLKVPELADTVEIRFRMETIESLSGRTADLIYSIFLFLSSTF